VRRLDKEVLLRSNRIETNHGRLFFVFFLERREKDGAVTETLVVVVAVAIAVAVAVLRRGRRRGRRSGRFRVRGRRRVVLVGRKANLLKVAREPVVEQGGSNLVCRTKCGLHTAAITAGAGANVAVAKVEQTLSGAEARALPIYIENESFFFFFFQIGVFSKVEKRGKDKKKEEKGGPVRGEGKNFQIIN